MRYLIILVIAIYFMGCGSKEQIVWKNDASNYLKKVQYAKLTGDKKSYLVYKKELINSVKKSANLEYLQMVELNDIALDIALLESVDFSEYDRLEGLEFSEKNHAFREFLANSNPKTDYIDKKYRSFISNINSVELSIKSVHSMDNDISKLIAFGVLASRYSSDERVYNAILDITKEKGYIAVTINALARLQAIYSKNGEIEQSKKIQELLRELLG